MTSTWPISTVGEQFDVQLGKMLDAAKNTGAPKPYLGNRAVKWGRIDLTAVGIVPLTTIDLQRFRLRSGDLLVCEGGEVGRAAIWHDELPECYYQKALHRLRAKSGYDARLMRALLEYWSSIGGFADYVTQTSIAHLPREKFIRMPLPLPPVPEQKLIGDVLEDAHDLIASLERLMAKKQAIKQRMAQRLLTGNARLPGYRGTWTSRPLDWALGRLQAGVSVNSVAGPGRLGILKTSCVSDGSFDPTERKTVAPGELARVKAIPRADSLVISRMNTPDLVGEVGYVEADHPTLFLPDRLWLATKRRGERVDMRWLAFMLSSGRYRQQLKETATGTSGSMKNIARGSFLALSLPFPALDEQAAIASVLADADAEIGLLKLRLDKAEAIMQGMAQQLLTGKTRLPELEAVA